MLKYNDIISKLTDEQKIRILTGVGNLAGKDLKILGIPFVKAEFLKDHGRDVYPHTTSVSRAWDPELWESIAKAKAKKMGEDGTNLAIVPGARIKVSPFRKEATEDPYLASVLSGSYMRGAAAGGLTAVASGFYVTESDTEWLDNEPNERVINEYLIAPYEKAAEFGGSTLKQIDRREIKEAYRDVCDYIHKAVESDTEFFVCDHASDENTVDFISRGIICLDASDNALSVALSRYKKLQQLFEQGKDVTSSQIEEEIVERRAISSDTVDLALDNTLDFIYKCAEKTSVAEEESESEALAKRAVLESTVLLKNEGDLLPIGRGRKIGIVGGIAFSDDEKENGGSGDDNINNVEKPEKDMAIKCVEAFEGMGYKKVRAARGYHMTDYGYMDEDAIRVCKRSDVTLLFLGAGYDAEKRITKTEKLTLPPNQLYFADKISASPSDMSILRGVIAEKEGKNSTEITVTVKPKSQSAQGGFSSDLENI